MTAYDRLRKLYETAGPLAMTTAPAQPDYTPEQPHADFEWVSEICNAYESGVGHNGRPTANVNPYPPGTPQHTAYELGAHGTKHNAQPAVPPDHVAWLRYNDHGGMKPTTLHLCDSDAAGAFRVYREVPAHPAVPDDVARDAARYRWLREHSQTGSVKTLLPLERCHYVVVHESAYEYQSFDDAIDAAIISATEGRKDE